MGCLHHAVNLSADGWPSTQLDLRRFIGQPFAMQGQQLMSYRLIGTLVVCAISYSVGLSAVHAQLTPPSVIGNPSDRTATLKQQLTNRLKAVTSEQQAYIDLLTQQVDQGKLDLQLVVAIERYALRRNPQFPFPFFERAIRFEAAKRGVVLPTVQQYASARNPLITTKR